MEPWIIEEEKRKEQERLEKEEKRQRIYIEYDDGRLPEKEKPREESQRGVVTIQIL